MRNKALTIFLAATVAAMLSAGAAGGRAFTAAGHPFARGSSDAFRVHAHASFDAFSAPLGFGFGSSLVGSAPTQPGPSAVAVDPATHTIYVANGDNADGPNAGGDTVSVIDARHCNAQDVSSCKGPWPTITVGDLPSTIAVDLATDTVYVTIIGDGVDDGTVSVFNGATCNASNHRGCGQAPASVPVGVTPIGIFADQANHTVYVGNVDNGNGDTVSMINSTTCNATDLGSCPTTEPPTVTVGNAPDDVDVDQATHTVYVAVAGGVSAFDADTCTATLQSGCGTVGTLSGDPNGSFSAKVDSANHTLYTANADDTVSAFDLRSCDAGDLAGCAADEPGTVTVPFALYPEFDGSLWLAVDTAKHSVYVAFYRSDTLRVIDTDQCGGADLAGCSSLHPPEIHTGTEPESVALDPTTQTVYTANEVDDDVSVIDASRCDAQNTRGCRHLPAEVATPGASVAISDPAAGTIYVLSGADTVAMVNAASCNAFHPSGCSQTPPDVTVGSGPFDAATDTATHTVYVADAGNGGAGSVSVFDDRTCNATDQAGCGNVSTLQLPAGTPNALVVDPLTDTLYVSTDGSSETQYVYVFNAGTCNAQHRGGCGQTPASVAVGSLFPSGVDVDYATNTVYVSSEPGDPESPGGYVSVINGDKCDAQDPGGCGHPVATVTIGTGPQQVGVEQATNTIYTANYVFGEYNGTVSVIDGATCSALQTEGCGHAPTTTAAGFGPFNLSIDQVSDHVYIENIQDDSVSVINGGICNGTRLGGCSLPSPKVSVIDYPTSAAIDHSVGTAYVGSPIGGVSVIPLIP